VKQQMVDMALNGSGIRDTARVLRVSPTTVITTLKKKSQAYSKQQFFTPCPDSHHDPLRLHGALVQGEVSFSRCISSYCTTGWRLPPLLYLSIIVTFIDMNNRAARLRILHAARPLTLCINGVYISAALEIIDTTT
jgi:hypothetical protein